MLSSGVRRYCYFGTQLFEEDNTHFPPPVLLQKKDAPIRVLSDIVRFSSF